MANAGELSDRISRLENIVANQDQQLTQLSNMQSQIQELRGNIEVLTNENAQLKKQQIAYFTDLDQRLQDQEKLSAAKHKGAGKKNSTTPTTAKSEITSTVAVKPAVATPAVIGHTIKKAENDTEAYQSAFNLTKEKKYSEAISAFRAFLTEHPDSNYVPNVHYWLGELYLVQKQNSEAKTEFSSLLHHYPQHPKVPDAMLKIALIDYEHGDSKTAIAIFKKIVTAYPGTTAANLAQAKLDSVKK